MTTPSDDFEAQRKAFWHDRARERAASSSQVPPYRHPSMDFGVPQGGPHGQPAGQDPRRPRGYSDTRFDSLKYTPQTGLRPPPNVHYHDGGVRYDRNTLGPPQPSPDQYDMAARRHSRRASSHSNAVAEERPGSFDQGHEQDRRRRYSSRSYSNVSQGQRSLEDAEKNMRLLHPGRAKIRDWKEGYKSPQPMSYSEPRSRNIGPIAGVAAGGAVGAVAVGGAAEAAKGGDDCCGFGECFGCEGSDGLCECFEACGNC